MGISFFAVDDKNELRVDMESIEQFSRAFDAGNRNDIACFAKIITTAYQNGFDKGVEESDQRHFHAQILLCHTAGNA